MSTSGEAADQMAREALQFSEVAIKLTALGFKNSLALALAYAKENPKVKGKTSLDRLLRENKELKVIPMGVVTAASALVRSGTGAGCRTDPRACRLSCGLDRDFEQSACAALV